MTGRKNARPRLKQPWTGRLSFNRTCPKHIWRWVGTTIRAIATTTVRSKSSLLPRTTCQTTAEYSSLLALFGAAGGGPIALALDDFDGDKQIDVTVANSRSSSFSLITRNSNGSFHFPVRDYVTGGTPLMLTTGDFNGDGMKDIAVASNSENMVDIFLRRRVMK